MLLDNSRSSWIAAPDGLERKSAGAEDGSVSRLAWATITKDTPAETESGGDSGCRAAKDVGVPGGPLSLELASPR